MHDRLYEKLCDILADMERKEKLSASDLQIIDWATHAKKSMLAIDEMEGGYSENEDGYSRRGDSYRNSYARGRNAKRDSMGRYAREGRNYSRDDGKEEYMEQLHELMQNAPDERSRQNIQRMIREVEQA
ncbi:MAG: hypothetical protein IJ179_10025 [Oscillospiraceae bacterium]|nr:hypothetical protein [Oscillospiraceae bacterium]